VGVTKKEGGRTQIRLDESPSAKIKKASRGPGSGEDQVKMGRAHAQPLGRHAKNLKKLVPEILVERRKGKVRVYHFNVHRG